MTEERGMQIATECLPEFDIELRRVVLWGTTTFPLIEEALLYERLRAWRVEALLRWHRWQKKSSCEN